MKIKKIEEEELSLKELEEKWAEFEKNVLTEDFLKNVCKNFVNEIITTFNNLLLNKDNKLILEKWNYYINYSFYEKFEKVDLTEDSFEFFLEQFSLELLEEDCGDEIESKLLKKLLKSKYDSRCSYSYNLELSELIFCIFGREKDFNFFEQFICEKCIEYNKELNDFIKEDNDFFNNLYDIVSDFDYEYYIHNQVEFLFNREYILNLIKDNPYHKNLVENYNKKIYKRDLIKDNILKSIPEDITLLYPQARKLKRKFILHIGPTNSGKTYESIESLKNAKNGIYLAPLRLMAFENYKKLNTEGISCTMETGEEILKVDGANHFSKTIELLNINTYYDVAVIDECQMIKDISRGGAWTRAILGLICPEIHICMAPEAKNIVINLIQMCNDEYEIIEHFRKTELKFTDEFKGYQKGDALIVFSRKDVIYCAAELQKKGIKCSILYGMLPYDVRHKEVEKFVNGDTDILVSTDVIGMGMNLPINRIIFLQNSKFDGTEKRTLHTEEIKQIAGRAGRFGIYDTGYVSAINLYDRRFIEKHLNKEVPQIEKAVLSFPENLINIDGKLSKIISEWKNILPINVFEKNQIDDMLFLCKKIEEFSDDKELLYKFLTIPFDVKKDNLIYLWFTIFKDFLKDGYIILNHYIYKPNFSSLNLEKLEELYQKLDLIFNCFRKFGSENDLEKIMNYKKDVVKAIDDILVKQSLEQKRCKYCGKILPWNHLYNMHEKCFKEQRRNQYDYYDWF